MDSSDDLSPLPRTDSSGTASRTRRIVVTGATGNVGTALLRRLAQEPDIDVVGVARRVPEAAPPYDGVQWHAVDIGASDAVARLRTAFAGADAVVHLAWLLQPNKQLDVLGRTNVQGTRNMLAAARDAGVAQVAVASSVGAYSGGPKSRRVDESWPTGGIHTSHYSRHKAVNERILDRFEREHPGIVVTRLRPGLVFQGDAGTEIPHLFVGPLVPVRVLRFGRPPVLPLPSRMITQAVHADDLADAFWRAIDRRAPGAFNIAAEPVLGRTELARGFGAARAVWFPFGVLRALASLSWRFGLQRADPGWLDIAAATPVMSTERARRELGWSPRHSSVDALAELVDAMADGRHIDASAPLSPPQP